MACHLFEAKPLSELMLKYCQLDTDEHNSMKLYLKFKRHLKISSAKWQSFCLGLNELSLGMFDMQYLYAMPYKYNFKCSRNTPPAAKVTGNPCEIGLSSLAPGRCGNNMWSIILKFIIQHSSLGSTCRIALRWMPQNLTNEKSTLVQVMACCCHPMMTQASLGLSESNSNCIKISFAHCKYLSRMIVLEL